MATYFVKVNTYWQNSADAFVGPFANKQAAQAAIESAAQSDNVCKSGQSCDDVKNIVRVYLPMSAPAAKRAGLREDWMNNRNVISRIPTGTSDLMQLQENNYN